MSRDVNKLSMDAQDELDDNIRYVQGVLELLFGAISSDNCIDNESGVLDVILDAKVKMVRVRESVDVLTAA